MHYIHTLSENQKKLIILMFILIPMFMMGLLMGLWANKRGLFKQVVLIRTTVKSAQGVGTSSRVTLSGVEIGKVENTKLAEQDKIEVTMSIQKDFNAFVRKDCYAVIAAEGFIGAKEFRITGGTQGAPMIGNGDFIKSIDQVDAENLMAKLSPVVDAAERIVLKIDKITASIPEQKINSSIADVSGILNDIKTGKSSVGKLVSTDNGEFVKKVDSLLAKIDRIAQKVAEGSDRLPETMHSVADITKSAASAAKDMEKEKTIQALLKNLTRVLEDIDKMAPALNKTVENAGNILGDTSLVTQRVPALMDDVEQTLNDTMVIVRGMKTGWPVNKFVPAEKSQPEFEPMLRETPQPATK
jgi:ABC-type transporter Mla subunit MlaD